MKVIFVIGSMSSGGAERVISEMSNYWAKKGWEITIITIGATKEKKDFYTLEKSINRVDLSLEPPKSKVATGFNLCILSYKIRAFIKKSKPDAVISFISASNVIVLMALLGIKLKKIISDRTDPNADTTGFFIKRITYPLADALVVQTDGVKSFYRGIPNLKILSIPNPITEPTFNNSKKIKFNKPTIVAVGSLKVAVKGFDLLIEAFAGISKKNLDWNLVILGEGKDRKILETLIKNYNLQDRIFLPGVIDNPRNTIVNADIFVLSSLIEGFPNVLIEAMSVGLPCISFDCASGPNEIIENNTNGILVEVGNVKLLQYSIERLIGSKTLRKKLGDRAKKDSIDRYYIDKVINKWEKDVLFYLK